MAKTETDSVLIKKKLEQMLPNMQFSVTRDSYAGGHSVYIGIKGGNIQPYTNPKNHTSRYSINEYHYKDNNELTPEIKEIIAKVMDIAFSINSGFSNRHSSSSLGIYLGVSTKTKSEPYKYIASTTKTSKSSGTSSNWSKGDLLKECAGWKVYKKTLPTGKIVYSAFKDKETAPNKTDWNTIKSEVYMQSGFKYGRFGNFQRWGSMTDNDENLNINALCEVLTKYYSSNTPATPEPESNESVDVYINGEFYKQFKNKDESIWSMGAKYGGTKWNELIANGKAIFSGNVWQINEKEETNSKQDEPQTEPFNINDSYKKLPANPKLEYCKIKYAEGLIDYADTFPKTFQSFTALTKYIADNIGEIPTQGYDKHGIEWKWKFEDSIGSSRWDVSENGANPVKYPNLYAGEKLRMLCYNAWAKLDSGGVTDDALKNIDEFYGTLVGKEGFELNTDQFNTILTDYLTYYKKDDDKRFLYITQEDRLKRFKDVYPRLIAAFEEKVDDKEEIIATIEALQYLADAGDDEAKTTIEALQYLI